MADLINDLTCQSEPSQFSLVTNSGEGAGLDGQKLEAFKRTLVQIEARDPMDFRREGMRQAKNRALSPLISQQDLLHLGQLQAIFQEPVFTSHRPFLGPFIVLYKRVMYRFCRKWLSITLQRQLEINQRMFNLAVTVRILEHRISQLEAHKREQSC